MQDSKVRVLLANAGSTDPSALLVLLDVISKWPGPRTSFSASFGEYPATEMMPKRYFMFFFVFGRGVGRSGEGVGVESVREGVGDGVGWGVIKQESDEAILNKSWQWCQNRVEIRQSGTTKCYKYQNNH